MALGRFGSSVPKVASSPKPHPEEAVGSLTWPLCSHLSHCYFLQAGLQPQPTLLVLQLRPPPPPSVPQDKPKMLGWPCMGHSSQGAGLGGPSAGCGCEGGAAWWEATWAEAGKEGGRLWESTCAGGGTLATCRSSGADGSQLHPGHRFGCHRFMLFVWSTSPSSG